MMDPNEDNIITFGDKLFFLLNFKGNESCIDPQAADDMMKITYFSVFFHSWIQN